MARAIWLVVGLLLSFAFALAPIRPSTINAQTICDQQVYDETGVLGSGKTSVETEVNNLALTGVNARVVIVSSTRPQTVKQFGDNLSKSCSSWQSLDGGARNNFVVIVVAVSDRQTGILYGDEWKRTLDPKWEDIIDERINPRFRDGDFSGGVVNGLKEIYRLLNAQINPPPPGSGGVTSPQGSGNNNLGTQTESDPTDLSGLWIVLGLAVLAVFLIVVGFFGFRITSGILKARASRRAAQTAAKLKKTEAIAQINSVSSRLAEVGPVIDSVAGRVIESDSHEMVEKLNEAKRLSASAAQVLSNNDTSNSDPDNTELNEAEYKTILAIFQDILDTATQAGESLNQAESLRKELMADLTELPKQIQGAEVQIQSTEATLPAIAALGFRTDHIEGGLREVKNLLENADQMFDQKNLSGAKEKLSQAFKLRLSLHDELVSLPERSQNLQNRISNLKGSADNLANRIVAANEVYDELDAKHPDSSLETIEGNGAESVKHLDAATDFILEAEPKASMEIQDWDGADVGLDQAEKEIEKANSLLNSVFKLKENLEIAQASAPDEIRAARADLERANTFVHEHDHDLPEHYESELARSAVLLTEASDEFSREKPDYLKVVRLAEEANSSVDKILARARSEIEELERQRALAASSLRDAQIAISVAEEYYQDHDSDIDNSVWENILRAKQDLSGYDNTSDLAHKIRIAQSAKELADKMLSRSKDQFREAERERQRVLEAATAASRRSSSWGSSGDFSGGYKPFGSSGGLSGGFKGFGGGRGFSGGSKGW